MLAASRRQNRKSSISSNSVSQSVCMSMSTKVLRDLLSKRLYLDVSVRGSGLIKSFMRFFVVVVVGGSDDFDDRQQKRKHVRKLSEQTIFACFQSHKKFICKILNFLGEYIYISVCIYQIGRSSDLLQLLSINMCLNNVILRTSLIRQSHFVLSQLIASIQLSSLLSIRYCYFWDVFIFFYVYHLYFLFASFSSSINGDECAPESTLTWRTHAEIIQYAHTHAHSSYTEKLTKKTPKLMQKKRKRTFFKHLFISFFGSSSVMPAA